MSIKETILRDAFSLSLIRKIRRKTDNNYIRNFFQIALFPIGHIKYLLSNYTSERKIKPKYGIGVVAIIKNEALYIEEWIAFYISQGIDKFIIYDNGSDDNIKSVLKPYINTGIVKYIYYPGKKMQCDVYNDAVCRYKDIFKYLMVIDADEFLYPINPKDTIVNIVDKVFEKNPNIGGCIINWLCYGSSGLKNKPDDYVINSYCNRGMEEFEANQNYKSIVDPKKVFSFTCPHYPHYRPGYYSVDTSGNKVSKSKNTGIYTDLRINHYFTKSLEEYSLKMNRGKADKNDKRGMEDFYRHDVNEIFDDSATRYLSKMKEIIKKVRSEDK